ncbi:hypothetical protein ABTH81_22420, partial [Acinetobacter baumannii]
MLIQLSKRRTRSQASRPQTPTPVVADLDPHLLLALDRFIEEEKPGSARGEALASIFRDWAIDQGFV